MVRCEEQKGYRHAHDDESFGGLPPSLFAAQTYIESAVEKFWCFTGPIFPHNKLYSLIARNILDHFLLQKNVEGATNGKLKSRSAFRRRS